jgi:hypothetical protein
MDNREAEAAHLKIRNKGLSDPQDIRGIVKFPVWDFIPVNNYIYPVLHGKIGLVNDAIDSFYGILDDNVEIMSDEEKQREMIVSLRKFHWIIRMKKWIPGRKRDMLI